MRNWDPRLIVLVGFILVIVGWIIPFLEVLQKMKSTFFWNFFSFAASFAGLMLGIVGTAFYTARRRKR
jgi:hypothetical protein